MHEGLRARIPQLNNSGILVLIRPHVNYCSRQPLRDDGLTPNPPTNHTPSARRP